MCIYVINNENKTITVSLIISITNKNIYFICLYFESIIEKKRNV